LPGYYPGVCAGCCFPAGTGADIDPFFCGEYYEKQQLFLVWKRKK